MEDEEVKISELPEAESVNDEDLVMIIQNGVNKKATVDDINKQSTTIITTSDGTAIKYADGTLIQYGIIDKTSFMTTTSTSTAVQGINWYRSNVASIAFPVSFISAGSYSINFSPRSSAAGARVYIPRVATKLASSCSMHLVAVEDFLETAAGYSYLTEVYWQAIGKWK